MYLIEIMLGDRIAKSTSHQEILYPSLCLTTELETSLVKPFANFTLAISLQKKS